MHGQLSSSRLRAPLISETSARPRTLSSSSWPIGGHAFLIPDNHLGRATVSCVAVAPEVEAMAGRSIACLNLRDRTLLGFRRDLPAAGSYGADPPQAVNAVPCIVLEEPRVHATPGNIG